MVGNLRVVDVPFAERAFARSGGELLAIRRLDGLGDAPQRAGHILREVAAVRARVADQLVALVEGLCGVKRLLRAEAEEAIGVALELREVVRQRRGSACGVAGG